MPNSFAGLAQRFPAEKEGQSVEEQVRELRDYSYQLLEYLRYALQNLDPSNFNETEMEKWANQITEPIYGDIRDAEGNITQLAVTAQGLQATVANQNGQIADLTLTANGLSSTVANQENKISNLTQTANSISATVSGMETTVDEMGDEIDVINTTMVTVNSKGMIVDTNGDVTAISGNCITTGTINLEDVQLANDYGSLEMANGSTGEEGTIGAALYGPNSDIYLIVTDAACRMTAGSTSFYVASNRIHADREIDVGSDARIKNTIEHDVADRYETMYRALQPARFKYNNGTSDRFHTGFIAQEMEQAIADGGLTNQDLAALVQGDDGVYAIRYAEMIALNTAFVQKLMDEVDSLKAELAALRGGNDAT